MPAKAVVNFSDIYVERFDDYVDSVFQIDYGLFPVVLLALVYTGYAVLTLRDGTTLTASNLDVIPKTSIGSMWGCLEKKIMMQIGPKKQESMMNFSLVSY